MSGYGAFARYYDKLTQNVGYSRRAAYFDTLVRRFAPQCAKGLLLDLACGTGSLSLELDALGYEVIGADASADMLSVAMQKAGERGRPILFLHQSMGELDLYGTVDVVVCALDSLNHLPDEDSLRGALQKVSLFLNPDGIFLFDVNTSYKHRQILADHTFVYEVDDLYCVWQNRCQGEHHRVDIALDFFVRGSDGRYSRVTEQFSERIFSPRLLDQCLEEAGLTRLAVLGDDSDQPPTDTTQRAVYVAIKNK